MKILHSHVTGKYYYDIIYFAVNSAVLSLIFQMTVGYQ